MEANFALYDKNKALEIKGKKTLSLDVTRKFCI